MKGVLVSLIAKVEGVVKEKFSGATPQTPTIFAPPIKIPGGAAARVWYINVLVRDVIPFIMAKQLVI